MYWQGTPVQLRAASATLTLEQWTTGSEVLELFVFVPCFVVKTFASTRPRSRMDRRDAQAAEGGS